MIINSISLCHSYTEINCDPVIEFIIIVWKSLTVPSEDALLASRLPRDLLLESRGPGENTEGFSSFTKKTKFQSCLGL